MDNKTQADAMLSQLYVEIRNHLNDSIKARNWCITVWMAALACLAYGKIELTSVQRSFLPFAPIFVFWILEAFHHTFASLHKSLAWKIEYAIANNTIDVIDSEELFPLMAFSKIIGSKKISSFLKCLFIRETVIGFYLLLALITSLFVYGMPSK